VWMSYARRMNGLRRDGNSPRASADLGAAQFWTTAVTFPITSVNRYGKSGLSSLGGMECRATASSRPDRFQQGGMPQGDEPFSNVTLVGAD
jgi:hypothetical protein